LKPERCHRKMVSGFTIRDMSSRPGQIRVSQYQQRPITAVQPQPSRRSSQYDVKLMMKKWVLGFQPASRLENVDNEDPEHAFRIKPIPRPA
jgi:hypothetical protein